MALRKDCASRLCQTVVCLNGCPIDFRGNHSSSAMRAKLFHKDRCSRSRSMKIAFLPLLLAASGLAAPPQRTSLNECLRSAGPSVYQCSFQAPPGAVDKHVRIVADALLSGAKVWLNGELIGEHKSGIAPFEFDLTPALKTGATNTLAMRLENPGILRDVYLLTTGRVFPVKQSVVAAPQRVAVSVTVRNTLDNTSGVQVSFTVSIGGKTVGNGSANAAIPPNLTQSIDAVIALRSEDVHLWDPDHPNLYRLRTAITKNAEAAEGDYETEIESAFGIRTVEIVGSQFLLNHEPLRLGGAHPAGEPSEEDLRSMKEAGMIFQLLDHTVSTAVLDWADRNGMLLIEKSEMRDRDANHPSVIAWAGATPDDSIATKRMDPTRPVTMIDFVVATPPSLMATSPVRALFLDAISEPDGIAELLRDTPRIFGAAAANSKDSRWAEQFRAARIHDVFQSNGNTFIEVRNSAGFPSQILRDYKVRVGPHTRNLPILKLGESATLEFEHVNPYRVEVRQPTGFVVDSR